MIIIIKNVEDQEESSVMLKVELRALNRANGRIRRNHLDKPKGLSVWILLLFAFLLSACGDNSNMSEQADGTGEENSGEHKTSEEIAETRTYESEKGPIDLPLHPERVVVIDQDYVGDVLATGLTPIATTGWAFEIPYYKEPLEGVENIGEKTTFLSKK